MSGGAYDYEYRCIENIAEAIQATTLLRRAFKRHLLKVARACHDIEWVDSADYGPGEEEEAIKACLGQDGPALVLDAAIAELEAAIEAAQEAHAAVQKKQ